MDTTWNQHFRRMAAQYGSRTAIIDGSRKLTYRELDRIVGTLAQALVQHGVKPRDTVAVMLDNSLEAAAAIQSVIRAGAAYVPINVRDAAMRKMQIISDSECRLVITESAYIFPELENGRVLLYQDAMKLTAGESPLPDSNSPDDGAYLLYTSGSTGTPKGAWLTHRNLLSQMEGLRQHYQLTETDIWSQFHSICFDFSVLEMFGALYNGAALVIVPQECKLDGSKMMRFISQNAVTVLGFVPSVMYKMPVEEADALRVRLMILGGEKLAFKSLIPWFRVLPELVAVNGYGLTETTIFNAGKDLTKDSDLEDAGNIGKAFAPNRMLLLDEQQNQITECGIAGEIVLGGSTISKGYFKNEALNKEKFITIEGFGEERFFRTGDYGKRSENGDIYFVGRRDNQVKLRGFRIEIEEIEGKLRKLSEVKDAAVKVDTEKEMLLAFVVPANPETDVSAIYQAAKSSLPEYMMPRRWKQLDELPVTDRGKVDKSRLILAEGEGLMEEFLPCKTPAECRIRTIWQQQLQTQEDIGLRTSYYELGGDSLSVMGMLERVGKAFSCEIRLAEFMEEPTIEHLANMTEESEKTQDDVICLEHIYKNHYPMTDLQQAFYIGREDCGAFGSSASHSYAEILCKGYSRERVEQVIRKLVDRHEMLRCCMDEDGTHHIYDHLTIRIPEHDLTGLSPERQTEAMHKIRHRMENMVLSPSEAPLARVEVSKCADDTAYVHLYADELIMDGWSHELLLHEADLLYADPDAVLPEITFTYGDFVEYSEKLKNTQKYRNAKAFWQAHLQEEPENPKLLIEEQKSASEQVTSCQMKKTISSEMMRKLEQNAAKDGLSSFIILFTAFCKSVARHSANQHFVVNLPVSNRSSDCKGIENLVGVCSNFFLFDFENYADETLLETAKRVQKHMWEIKEHDSFTGNEIIREIYRTSGEVGGFVADMVFTSLLDMPFDALHSLERTYLETHTSQILMDTVIMREKDGISYNCDYVEGVIEDSLAASVIDTSIGLVLRYAQDSASWRNDRTIALNASDRHLLAAKNAGKQALPDRSVVDYLSQFAASEPDAPYLLTEQGTYSYADVYRDALRLRNAFAVAAEKPVIGIVMSKSYRQITAIYAALLTGGVYVPIDNEFPAEVIRDIAQKTGMHLIVTDQAHIAAVSEAADANIRILNVDTPLPETVAAAPAKRSIYDPFVIIFTSGTTGKPKGIRLSEAGIMNSILFTNRRYNASRKDTALALTNICHDMSMYDIFGMAAAGASVILPEYGGAKDPECWKKLLYRYDVSIINSVPAFTEMLLMSLDREEAEECLYSLRLVIQGGDFLKPSHARNITALPGKPQLVNVGGPTETSLWSIYHDVTPEEIASGRIPYGSAIANMEHLILNEFREEVPKNVVGSIYSCGVGLAEEYVGLPELTAERFVEIGGKRYFNTGDQGYYRDDYEMMIKGRNDHQVKINGKRIELEEIESCMNLIDGISGSCCLYLAKKNQLIAFYASDREFEKSELAEALSGQLVSYMIPKQFIRMEQLPLTRNGKLNRKRMQQEAENFMQREAASETDHTVQDERDELLLGIAKRILEREDLSCRDNFFMEGGNSILAIRLIAAIKEQTGAKLRIGDIFANPVIGTWKQLLLTAEPKRNEAKASGKLLTEAPLSPVQEGIYFYEQIHQNAKYTVLAYADLHGTQPIQTEALSRAVNAAVRRSVLFRTRIKTDADGMPYQYTDDSIPFPTLTITETSADPDSLIAEYAEKPIDTAAEPPAEFIYLKTSDFAGRLLMRMHHLITDEASLEHLYTQIVRQYFGDDTTDPTGYDRYYQYATEKKTAQPDAAQIRKTYSELEAIRQMDLRAIVTTNYQRPVVHTKLIQLPESVEDRLRTLCRMCGCTMFAAAYGIYNAALYLTFGEEQLVTSTTFSDRLQEADAACFGMYACNQIFCTPIDFRTTLRQIITALSAQITKRYAGELLPANDVIRTLELPDDALKLIGNRVFTFVDQDRKTESRSGITFAPLEIAKNVGDMNLNLLIERLNGSMQASVYYSDAVSEADMDIFTEKLEQLFAVCDTAAEESIVDILPDNQKEDDLPGELMI